MEEKASFRNRFREALELRDLRAAEFSAKSGIPKGAISYYLAGKSEPKADRLHEIAVALNVSEAWLLGYNVDLENKKNPATTDGMSENRKKLMRFVEGVPEEKAEMLLRVMKSILEAD